MKIANKTRAELAAALEITVQAVGEVVRNGSSSFSVPNHYKAAAFLGVDHYWLATGEGTMRIVKAAPKDPRIVHAVNVLEAMSGTQLDTAMKIVDALAKPGDGTSG